MRLFISFHPPPEIQDRLLALALDLQKTVSARWTKPGQFHVTLKFLGNLSEVALPSFCSGLERLAQGFSPMEIGLAGLGAFPALTKAQILWVGVVEKTNGLPRLAEALDAYAAPFGVPKEDRPYHPHVTLARLKTPRPLPTLLPPAPLPPFLADTLSLMESRSTPSGSQYVELQRFPLK